MQAFKFKQKKPDAIVWLVTLSVPIEPLPNSFLIDDKIVRHAKHA